MPISILRYQRAWHTFKICHTLQIFKNDLFFIDEQMILLSFFDNTNLLEQSLEKVGYHGFQPNICKFVFAKVPILQVSMGLSILTVIVQIIVPIPGILNLKRQFSSLKIYKVFLVIKTVIVMLQILPQFAIKKKMSCILVRVMQVSVMTIVEFQSVADEIQQLFCIQMSFLKGFFDIL